MNNQLALSSFDDLARAAQAVAESKLFGVTTPEQAIALFLVAQSEGRHPASAAKEYHIIKGRPSLKADAILARFQQAGGSVRWNERTETAVSATFSHPQGGDVEIRWTLDDARRAGLASGDGWRKYPRHMLSARVISEGVRACYAPVVCGLYTPEEVEQFDAPAPAPAAKPLFKSAQKAVSKTVEVEAEKSLPPPASAEQPEAPSKPNAELVDRIVQLGDENGVTVQDVIAFLNNKGLVKDQETLGEFDERVLRRVIHQFAVIADWVQVGRSTERGAK